MKKYILNPAVVFFAPVYVLLVLLLRFAHFSWLTSILVVSISYAATGLILCITWVFVEYYVPWHEEKFKN